MVSSSIVASLNFTFIATLLGHPIMMEAVTLDGPQTGRVLLGVGKLEGYPSSADAEIISTVDGLMNSKWLDNFTLEIGVPLSISHLYQDNLSAFKIASKLAKRKQVKYLLEKSIWLSSIMRIGNIL